MLFQSEITFIAIHLFSNLDLYRSLTFRISGFALFAVYVSEAHPLIAEMRLYCFDHEKNDYLVIFISIFQEKPSCVIFFELKSANH